MSCALASATLADSRFVPLAQDAHLQNSHVVSSEGLTRWTNQVLDTFSSGNRGLASLRLFSEAVQSGSDTATANKEKEVWTIGTGSATRSGSGQLLLSAFLAAGCFQITRHRHDFKLMSLPQWYHSDGPAQVGHAVAFDLQYAPLVVCIFNEPASKLLLSGDHIQSGLHSRYGPQYYAVVAALRGPPSLA